MLWITEYAYNACERNGTLDSMESFKNRLKALEIDSNLEKDKVYSRIYLGFEFCENMMSFCRIDHVKQKIELAVKEGYKVSFVFPMMHQKRIPLFKEWIRQLVQLDRIDEWIVNDPGTFLLLDEAGVDGGFVLGRMFDKSIREARQNILDIPEIRDNFDVLQPENSFHGIREILKEKYHINGAEVDTFPDGILKLKDDGMHYHVHYPDIYLSCSTYCEYANGSHNPNERFLLHTSCGAECRHYEQKIICKNGRVLYKTGNVMLCRQNRSPGQSIEGCCRMVYSDRIYQSNI